MDRTHTRKNRGTSPVLSLSHKTSTAPLVLFIAWIRTELFKFVRCSGPCVAVAGFHGFGGVTVTNTGNNHSRDEEDLTTCWKING